MTKIEWTDAVWNPATGCSKVSPACTNCYAERMAKRLRGRHGYPAGEPFRLTLHPERLDEPLRWKKPRHVFVCSMGDLFHEDVPDEFIRKVFSTMRYSPQHTFQILTKRPERMKRLHFAWARRGKQFWPRNVWAGTSVESQKHSHRIETLLQVPAAVHFVSLEPLLGSVVILSGYLPNRLAKSFFKETGLDWVIAGGESGPGARPMNPEWVRSIRDQCVRAQVPFFFKQWGEWAPFATTATYKDGEVVGGYCGGPGWLSFAGMPAGKCTIRSEGYGQKGIVRFYRQEPTHLWGRHNEMSMDYVRVGKKHAGCLLDGRTWLEKPRGVNDG